MKGILANIDGKETQVTVDTFFSHLAGEKWATEVLLWPPDVFCLIAALLQKTGGYIKYIRNWPPAVGTETTQKEKLDRWSKEIEAVALEWWYASSLAIDKKTGVAAPPQIQKWWDVVVNGKKLTLDDLEKELHTPTHDAIWEVLLQLCSAADEACVKIGIGEISPYQALLGSRPIPQTDMLWVASNRLIGQRLNKTPHTLTRNIRQSMAVVLPKFHTPQSGITLRSISHNLAFIRSSEVTPTMDASLVEVESLSKSDTPRNHTMNLVLFPWPLEMVPADFKAVNSTMQTLAPEFGFFGYEPKDTAFTETQRQKLQRAIKRTGEMLGSVDGVVFPELALMESNKSKVFQAVREACSNCFVIAGIGDPNGPYATNKAAFWSHYGADLDDIIEQHKHHRWQLDRSQIDQYGLGSQLDPTKRGWWEHIEIKPRQLSFLSVQNRNIALSVLICEDLARQDPIGEIIRSIGPDLVIALLMDGPQIGRRWSARYATVFADDPGSSVLTLTSLGMVQLPLAAGYEPSRVVGLWKDRFQGSREITLAPDSDAVALSVTIENHVEWTADGRKDRGNSTYLRLNGIHQIRAP